MTRGILTSGGFEKIPLANQTGGGQKVRLYHLPNPTDEKIARAKAALQRQVHDKVRQYQGKLEAFEEEIREKPYLWREGHSFCLVKGETKGTRLNLIDRSQAKYDFKQNVNVGKSFIVKGSNSEVNIQTVNFITVQQPSSDDARKTNHEEKSTLNRDVLIDLQSAIELGHAWNCLYDKIYRFLPDTDKRHVLELVKQIEEKELINGASKMPSLSSVGQMFIQAEVFLFNHRYKKALERYMGLIQELVSKKAISSAIEVALEAKCLAKKCELAAHSTHDMVDGVNIAYQYSVDSMRVRYQNRLNTIGGRRADCYIVYGCGVHEAHQWVESDIKPGLRRAGVWVSDEDLYVRPSLVRFRARAATANFCILVLTSKAMAKASEELKASLPSLNQWSTVIPVVVTEKGDFKVPECLQHLIKPQISIISACQNQYKPTLALIGKALSFEGPLMSQIYGSFDRQAAQALMSPATSSFYHPKKIEKVVLSDVYEMSKPLKKFEKQLERLPVKHIAIVGPDGCGKCSLALKYADKLWRQVDHILFIDGENASTICSGLQSYWLKDPLDRLNNGGDISGILNYIADYFRANFRETFLFVITRIHDDKLIQKISSALERCNGTIIFTSTQTNCKKYLMKPCTTKSAEASLLKLIPKQVRDRKRCANEVAGFHKNYRALLHRNRILIEKQSTGAFAAGVNSLSEALYEKPVRELPYEDYSSLVWRLQLKDLMSHEEVLLLGFFDRTALPLLESCSLYCHLTQIEKERLLAFPSTKGQCCLHPIAYKIIQKELLITLTYDKVDRALEIISQWSVSLQNYQLIEKHCNHMIRFLKKHSADWSNAIAELKRIVVRAAVEEKKRQVTAGVIETKEKYDSSKSIIDAADWLCRAEKAKRLYPHDSEISALAAYARLVCFMHDCLSESDQEDMTFFLTYYDDQIESLLTDDTAVELLDGNINAQNLLRAFVHYERGDFANAGDYFLQLVEQYSCEKNVACAYESLLKAIRCIKPIRSLSGQDRQKLITLQTIKKSIFLEFVMTLENPLCKEAKLHNLFIWANSELKNVRKLIEKHLIPDLARLKCGPVCPMVRVETQDISHLIKSSDKILMVAPELQASMKIAQSLPIPEILLEERFSSNCLIIQLKDCQEDGMPKNAIPSQAKKVIPIINAEGCFSAAQYYKKMIPIFGRIVQMEHRDIDEIHNGFISRILDCFQTDRTDHKDIKNNYEADKWENRKIPLRVVDVHHYFVNAEEGASPFLHDAFSHKIQAEIAVRKSLNGWPEKQDTADLLFNLNIAISSLQEVLDKKNLSSEGEIDIGTMKANLDKIRRRIELIEEFTELLETTHVSRRHIHERNISKFNDINQLFYRSLCEKLCAKAKSKEDLAVLIKILNNYEELTDCVSKDNLLTIVCRHRNTFVLEGIMKYITDSVLSFDLRKLDAKRDSEMFSKLQQAKKAIIEPILANPCNGKINDQNGEVANGYSN